MRKLHKTVIALGVCCVILFCPSVSLAWGPEAHKIIAQIAWDQLQPATKKKIMDLLLSPKALKSESAGNKAFVDASTWADDIRIKRPELNAEHFIDRPFPTEGKPPEPNLLTALKKNLELLQNSRDKNVRAEALKFIIHYVGDIHQPLHCATRTSANYPQGDQGGNRIRILITDSGGKVRNVSLHSYWDTGLESFSGAKFSVSDTSRRLERIYPDGAAITGNFQEWSVESFNLAKETAYVGFIENERVTVRYRSAGVLTVDKQLAKAGYRLARLLTAILP